MKGDNVKMTLNIAGELFELDVDFNQQLSVREAERDVKQFCDKLKKSWPEKSDRNILAMAAFQFAKWYRQLLEIQQEAISMSRSKCSEIDRFFQEENS